MAIAFIHEEKATAELHFGGVEVIFFGRGRPIEAEADLAKVVDPAKARAIIAYFATQQ